MSNVAVIHRFSGIHQWRIQPRRWASAWRQVYCFRADQSEPEYRAEFETIKAGSSGWPKMLLGRFSGRSWFRSGGFLSHRVTGLPQIIQVMNDHDWVLKILKPLVTWGCPILRKPERGVSELLTLDSPAMQQVVSTGIESGASQTSFLHHVWSCFYTFHHISFLCIFISKCFIIFHFFE